MSVDLGKALTMLQAMVEVQRDRVLEISEDPAQHHKLEKELAQLEDMETQFAEAENVAAAQGIIATPLIQDADDGLRLAYGMIEVQRDYVEDLRSRGLDFMLSQAEAMLAHMESRLTQACNDLHTSSDIPAYSGARAI